MMTTEQTQKMKNEPDLSKPWPFPVVLGVDNRGLSDLDDKFKQNQSKCNMKYTKEPKCKLYDTFDDLGEPLF
jgi:hypothetical protein